MRTCSPVNERNGTAKLFMLFAPLAIPADQC
jgi:hypothetical protein